MSEALSSSVRKTLMRNHRAVRHTRYVTVDVRTPEGKNLTWQAATEHVGSALRIAPAFVATTTDAALGVETTVEAHYVRTEGRYVIKRVTNTAVRDDVELNYPTVAKVG